MINFNEITEESTQKRNPQQPQNPNQLNIILMVEGSGSGKKNTLINLINHQLDVGMIYLYDEGPYESMYNFLIKKWQDVGL